MVDNPIRLTNMARPLRLTRVATLRINRIAHNSNAMDSPKTPTNHPLNNSTNNISHKGSNINIKVSSINSMANNNNNTVSSTNSMANNNNNNTVNSINNSLPILKLNMAPAPSKTNTRK